jgi:hypothetical protein
VTVTADVARIVEIVERDEGFRERMHVWRSRVRKLCKRGIALPCPRSPRI